MTTRNRRMHPRTYRGPKRFGLPWALMVALLAGPGAGQATDAATSTDEPAELYRWTDDQGREHFSDSPPQGQPAGTLPQAMPQMPPSGVRLTDETLQPKPAPEAAAARKKTKTDSRCRRYHSDLNEIELYLQHTPNARDQQRAADLKEQIAIECNGYALKRDYGDRRCRQHHGNLNKLEIYYRHSPTQRDKRKIDDLKRQIELEC